MKQNTRYSAMTAMATSLTFWDHCVIFHGHSCPGLAIGYRISLAAFDRLDLLFSEEDKLVCVAENDACSVDAVQVLTGCTMGKGNLLYRDTGQHAFSFFNRMNNSQVRITFNNLIKENKAWTKEELQDYILHASEEEILFFSEPSFELSQHSRLFNNITCEQCGKIGSEPKIRLKDGKKICLDCVVD